MSEHERALLVTGTLDTSGVGGSPYERLDQVAVAFGAEVHEGDHAPQEAAPVAPEAEAPVEPNVAEKAPSVVEEEAKAEEKPAPRKRTAKKTAAKEQASAPAES
ncbi:hypothetical protein [Streptomyces griseoaurantiacus]|uniref:hypothetical protein n=1 Tax=Streptomyces griseoaurantiacus TaxID=68213 RepID=UPI0036890721